MHDFVVAALPLSYPGWKSGLTIHFLVPDDMNNNKHIYPGNDWKLTLTFVFALNPGKVSANTEVFVNSQTFYGDEYTYVYNTLDGVVWVFVYDSKGNFITSYPAQ